MLVGPNDASLRDVDCDVCVIGAGPAGITVATEYIDSSLSVTLLESGGFELDPRADALGAGTVDSSHFRSSALAGGRRRQFGGTSNLWGYETQPASGRYYARSLPPEPSDWSRRSWQPNSGWPFTTEAMGPYHAMAQALWNRGPLDYSLETWAAPGDRCLELSPDIITTKIAQHGSSDVFALRYRDDLLSAPNIEVRLRTTVVRLEFDRTGSSVLCARAVGPEGQPFSVRAKAFILAAGGIENAQLLLLSDATQPGGPANKHDNIGRFVTDHPEFRMGVLTPTHGGGLMDRLGLYDLHWSGQFMISGYLTLAESVKEQEQLLNVSVALVPQPAGYASDAERAIRSLYALKRKERPAAAWQDVKTLITSPRDAAAVLRAQLRRSGGYSEYQGGWSRPSVDRSRFQVVEMHAATEQTAERYNRVTLGPRRDLLGRRQPALRWRWNPKDQDNVRRSLGIIAGEIEQSGLGQYSPWVDFNGPLRPVYSGIHHPMGGTRMHDDPGQGVVDDQCRVHGVNNLYLAGSSVFSTGHGYANPTLTLLALAIRLAKHVTHRLGEG